MAISRKHVKNCKRIENLRNKMELLASEKGFSHVETVKISQQLDDILNFYMDKINKKKEV